MPCPHIIRSHVHSLQRLSRLTLSPSCTQSSKTADAPGPPQWRETRPGVQGIVQAMDTAPNSQLLDSLMGCRMQHQELFGRQRSQGQKLELGTKVGWNLRALQAVEIPGGEHLLPGMTNPQDQPATHLGRAIWTSSGPLRGAGSPGEALALW